MFSKQIIGAGLFLSLVACGGPEAEPVDEMAAAASSPPATYLWRSGLPATQLAPAKMGTVCYLTRVQGNLLNKSTGMRVYKENGSWYLTGSGIGVSGEARCVTANGGDTEYAAESSNADGTHETAQTVDVPLAASSGKVCVLTRLQGRFDKDWDSVVIDKAGDGLYHVYVRGETKVAARCFTASHVRERYWDARTGGFGVAVVPIQDHDCGLIAASGRYSLSTDYAACNPGTKAYFWLTGSGDSSGGGTTTQAKVYGFNPEYTPPKY